MILFPKFELVFHKSVVNTTPCRKLLMRTLLHHFPMVKDDDIFRMTHGAESVSHDEYGFAFVELVEVVHNDFFIISIERVGRLVKEDVFRVFIHGACYEYSLSLPLANAASFHANLRVVTHREGIYEVADVSNADCMP